MVSSTNKNWHRRLRRMRETLRTGNRSRAKERRKRETSTSDRRMESKMKSKRRRTEMLS
jgi:hypothetical protein